MEPETGTCTVTMTAEHENGSRGKTNVSLHRLDCSSCKSDYDWETNTSISEVSLKLDL